MIVSLLALALGFTSVPQMDVWQQAHLTRVAESGAIWMRAIMPDAAAQLVQLQDTVTAAGAAEGE
jgi:uncharacterized membrane protein required for colicin V production